MSAHDAGWRSTIGKIGETTTVMTGWRQGPRSRRGFCPSSPPLMEADCLLEKRWGIDGETGGKGGNCAKRCESLRYGESSVLQGLARVSGILGEVPPADFKTGAFNRSATP